LAPQLPDLAVLLAEAEVLHPQLSALRARVESSRNEVLKAKSIGKPTFDVVARVTRSEGENTLNPDGDFSNHQIGVQFNWPIYQGGGHAAAVREAVARLEEANQRLLAARDDLALRLENQYRSVQEGRLRIQALRQAQRSASEVLVSSQRSFEAGSRTRLDVMNAHQALAQSNRDLTQGRLNYLSAEVQLALLAGFDSEQAIARIGMWFSNNSAVHTQHTDR
jgi:outer membrane protein TolC